MLLIIPFGNEYMAISGDGYVLAIAKTRGEVERIAKLLLGIWWLPIPASAGMDATYIVAMNNKIIFETFG